MCEKGGKWFTKRKHRENKEKTKRKQREMKKGVTDTVAQIHHERNQEHKQMVVVEQEE